MNILIVGHRSLVGKRLITNLGNKYKLVLAGRNPGSDIPFDLLDDADDLATVPKCDALIHCAASFCPDTMEGAEINERTNSVGCFHVLKLAERAGCAHIIYLASIFSVQHPENEYYGSYGISKSHGEDNLNHCCNLAGIHFTSLRLSQIYDDAGEARKHQPLLYHIMDKAREGKGIIFHGKKDPVRNFLYVDDVVQIIERTLLTQTEGLHPVLFPVSYTLSAIARLAYSTFATEAIIQFLEDKPDIKTIHLPVVSDLYERLHYTPTTDLRAGMIRIRDVMYGVRSKD
jgi:nucleoside-diphosphate-sugar epimerase